MASLISDIEQEFSLKHWVLKMSQEAKHIRLATHPSKYSHASADDNKNGKTTAIVARKPAADDGLLRAGNMPEVLDAVCSAAYTSTFDFLQLSDSEQSLLMHLEQDTALAKEVFSAKGVLDYQEIKTALLVMLSPQQKQVTSPRIKQVYFPISASGDETEYHQLSLLRCPGMMYTLKARINHRQFSEQAKLARACKEKGQWSALGFSTFAHMTIMGYGGTQPQNLGMLNSKNAGKVYLLPSVPPVLEKRAFRHPTKDFFKQTVVWQQFNEIFKQCHQSHLAFLQHENNRNLRKTRNSQWRYAFAIILRFILQVREQAAAWSFDPKYQDLVQEQKKCLDTYYDQQTKPERRQAIKQFIHLAVPACLNSINVP